MTGDVRAVTGDSAFSLGGSLMPAGCTTYDWKDHYYYVLLLDDAGAMYLYRMQLDATAHSAPGTMGMRYLVPSSYYPTFPITALLFNSEFKLVENPDRGLIATVEDNGHYKMLLLDISQVGGENTIVEFEPGQSPVLFSAKFDPVNNVVLTGACYSTDGIVPSQGQSSGCNLVSLNPSQTMASTTMADRSYHSPTFRPGVMPYIPAFPVVVPPLVSPVGTEDLPFRVIGLSVTDGDVSGRQNPPKKSTPQHLDLGILIMTPAP